MQAPAAKRIKLEPGTPEAAAEEAAEYARLVATFCDPYDAARTELPGGMSLRRRPRRAAPPARLTIEPSSWPAEPARTPRTLLSK